MVKPKESEVKNILDRNGISTNLVAVLVVIIIAAVGFAAYIMAPGGGGISNGENIELEMRNNSFQPSAMEIEVGETVKIINRDSVNHTFTAQDPESDEVVVDESLNGGESISYTFDTEGVWNIWCTVHSDGTNSEPATSGMMGKIGVGVPAGDEGGYY